MSLTKAEQVVALFRGHADVDSIVEIVSVTRQYALHALTEAGLRTKQHLPFRCVPEADLPPRVYRDPCGYCGVRGDIGCVHSKWAA